MLRRAILPLALCILVCLCDQINGFASFTPMEIDYYVKHCEFPKYNHTNETGTGGHWSSSYDCPMKGLEPWIWIVHGIPNYGALKVNILRNLLEKSQGGKWGVFVLKNAKSYDDATLSYMVPTVKNKDNVSMSCIMKLQDAKTNIIWLYVVFAMEVPVKCPKTLLN